MPMRAWANWKYFASSTLAKLREVSYLVFSKRSSCDEATMATGKPVVVVLDRGWPVAEGAAVGNRRCFFRFSLAVSFPWKRATVCEATERRSLLKFCRKHAALGVREFGRVFSGGGALGSSGRGRCSSDEAGLFIGLLSFSQRKEFEDAGGARDGERRSLSVVRVSVEEEIRVEIDADRLHGGRHARALFENPSHRPFRHVFRTQRVLDGEVPVFAPHGEEEHGFLVIGDQLRSD